MAGVRIEILKKILSWFTCVIDMFILWFHGVIQQYGSMLKLVLSKKYKIQLFKYIFVFILFFISISSVNKDGTKTTSNSSKKDSINCTKCAFSGWGNCYLFSIIDAQKREELFYGCHISDYLWHYDDRYLSDHSLPHHFSFGSTSFSLVRVTAWHDVTLGLSTRYFILISVLTLLEVWLWSLSQY